MKNTIEPASKMHFCYWNTRMRGLTKNLFSFLLIFLFLLPVVTSAQDKDEEAIKGVIRSALDASLTKNGEAWQKLWVHDAKVSRARLFNLNYLRITGWDNLGPATLKAFKENPTPDPSIVKLDSFMIRKVANMAWVEYNAITTLTDNGETVSRPSHEYRVLVKDNNQWKIASSISHVTADLVSTPQAMENNLNELGYKYLLAKKVNEAIEIFKLNVQLYPGSWNPYDSLGEAYALAGNKELAVKNYEKSIELNPKNENGINILKKLKGN